MKQSFFVQSGVSVDDIGLFVNVDLEKTNEAVNQLLIHIEAKEFEVESITPVTSGVGQFQCGIIPQNQVSLSKWPKSSGSSSYGYGFGYSYTSGFMIFTSNVKDR